MTRIRRGDVLLLPFPFTDSPSEKKRPVVVVSSEAYMSETIDVLVAMITTRARPAPRSGDHKLADWQGAGLIGPSTVRARLATVHSKRVIRKLGAVSNADMAGIDNGLRAALAL
jgi:mRNA interferase MazF